MYNLGIMSVLGSVLGVHYRLVCNVQGVQGTLYVHLADVQWYKRCTRCFVGAQWEHCADLRCSARCCSVYLAMYSVGAQQGCCAGLGCSARSYSV